MELRPVPRSTWEDNGVFVLLGLPILPPRYWREGFEMDAFVVSLGG